jgi:predicted phage terminase large subunit-like protein
MVYRKNFICRGSALEGRLNRLVARGLSGIEWFDHECMLPRIRLRHHRCRIGNKLDNGGSLGVCTSWGIHGKNLYLIDLLRRRMEYPELKREVRAQYERLQPSVVLIEDKASGTQLIQELIAAGVLAVTRYQPQSDKVMRMHAQTAMIENGFVHLPEAARWLAAYLHELTSFPKGRHDDQVDSTAQMLEWFKQARQRPQL